MNKALLEALERLAMPDDLHIKECKKVGIGLTEDYEVMEKALLNAEKEHKALEIIKKTKNIKVSFYENGSGKHYKIEFDRTRNQTITEEEFNLLKGILNDEQ